MKISSFHSIEIVTNAFDAKFENFGVGDSQIETLEFLIYPRGLIIAIKLKSISDEVPSKQNGADEQANDNNDVSKTDESPPSETAAGESDQKVSENNDNGEENNEKKEEKETYIDFKIGAELGYIQFDEAEAAQKACAAAEPRWQKLKLCFLVDRRKLDN
ncbi:hypothetical protein RIF29_07230 [Crotalaria pallida]|uniref:Uncharacterized protein n=1 Tax=Crotalaria pallida TaxID=3830 RepID=A0AAN9PBZ3_CROPI